MEEQICKRQVTKLAVAKRVVDEQQVHRHFTQNDLVQLYTENIDPQNITPLEDSMTEDEVLRKLIPKHNDIILRFHDHDTFLENKTGEELTQAERERAWTEYELYKKKSK